MGILTKQMTLSLLVVGLMSCAYDEGADQPSLIDSADSASGIDEADADPQVLAQQAGSAVNETIVVKKGQTFDGKNKRFTAGKALGDGSQREGQRPLFKLEDGARLINVVIGNPAADGVHTYGNVQLQNIHWEDIGEDAMTIKQEGNVTLNGGSAKEGEDKIFQINAASSFRISNFKADGAGKFVRQNGDTTFKIQVFIDKCDIANMKEAIFRTDSKSSTVTMTNTRYHNIGKQNFIVPSKSQVKESNNTAY